MTTSRRSFIKTLLAGGLLSGGTLVFFNINTIQNFAKGTSNDTNDITQIGDSLDYPNPNDSDKAWGMIIDLNKCTGCSDNEQDETSCSSACRTMHNVPPEQEWIKIYFVQDNPMQKGYYFPRVCMQCENPPCRQICPVGAALRRDNGDGLVLIDHDTCIGCRLCISACPYEARYFNWEDYDEPNKVIIFDNSPMYVTKHEKGTVNKCDFCGHMVYQGLLPACVSACSEGALYYGNLKENAVTNSHGETLDVAKTISEKGGFRFKEEFGTKPRVYYLPQRK
ncbi:MAG: 4Fe-4S dicluster domain-containing protein [Candidatus Hodarchaeales archaeon]|jgi:molybdopterin-containing oxidoreductase family iron-sulfur binding subunit